MFDLERITAVFSELKTIPESKRIEIINAIRLELHKYSPFKHEPVDCVLWVPQDKLLANDYNPNTVAPPEMQLLEHSVREDGYTQPIVSWQRDGIYEVVDGFHRNRVGREISDIKARIHGHLPVSVIKTERTDRNDRIASTIRHNRARGKHKIDAMSDIVIELKNRNWTNYRISKELGMDEDEILRLCQITGLEDIFKDTDFSKSWDIADSSVDDFDVFTDEVTEMEQEEFNTIPNTSDPERIFHTFDKWECYKAGFYNKYPPDGMTRKECELRYAEFLSDNVKFSEALQKVTTEWKYSCEHYLTNSALNRVAWLGQAALCYSEGIPSEFRTGFHLLSSDQQDAANKVAHSYLNKWLVANGRAEVNIEDALSAGRQQEIY